MVADSFVRIFYRNAINLGLPVIVCKEIAGKVNENDRLLLDLMTGEIQNITQKTNYKGEGLPEHIIEILKAGGIKPLFKARY